MKLLFIIFVTIYFLSTILLICKKTSRSYVIVPIIVLIMLMYFSTFFTSEDTSSYDEKIDEAIELGRKNAVLEGETQYNLKVAEEKAQNDAFKKVIEEYPAETVYKLGYDDGAYDRTHNAENRTAEELFKNYNTNF